jgi:hypothetical protein
MLLEKCGVLFSRLQNSFFAIVENVDVVRKAGASRFSGVLPATQLSGRGASKKCENVALHPP